MENFDERQKYNAVPIHFLNKLIIPLAPMVLLVLALFPLGLIESTNFNWGGYIAVNLIVLAVVGVKLFQLFTYRQSNLLTEVSIMLSIGLAATLAFLYVLNFQSPIVVFWIMLIVAAYASLGVFGYCLMTGILFCLGVFDIFNQVPVTTTYAFNNLQLCLFLSTIGYVMSHMLHLTASSERNLERTRSGEVRQRDRLHTVINSMAEGLISLNKNGTVNLHNATLLAILDTNDNLVGKSADDIFHLFDEHDQPVPIKLLLKNSRQVVVRNDLRHRLANGEFIDLHIQIVPVRPSFRSASDEGYMITARDITKEKSLDEERDEFISVVSHELRTPIAIAEGSLSNLVVLQSRGAKPNVLAASANMAHEQIMYLSKMVNDLSTLSRAERGVGDTKEVIDLNELLKSLYDKYEPEARAKKLHLNLDIQGRLPRVLQSRLYLEEMLQNFITNAIKYTPEGSVTIKAEPTKDGGVECAVSDTGIGVSRSDQKKIFQKFYRSEDYRTRETNGTGLGLYVVRKLASKMGVTIEVKSRLNHGSRFSFVLPAHKPAEGAASVT